jgi:dTDP-4-amino-4,6-dideoxygalactose transaminase/protein involved in polysaccharide export with SLBB domain
MVGSDRGLVPTDRSTSIPAIAGGVPVRPPARTIVFGAPVIGDAEIASVAECLRSRWIGVGPRVQRLEEAFARYKGAPYATAVSSGTAALHLALVALGVGPGDEVIAPTMTFCSTIHAIVHAGATPVLVDCDRATFNVTPEEIERRVTRRTKVVLLVHMCGRSCDMDPIMEIARRQGLRVVEDCAHAIETKYHGRPAGLVGDVGCFSFYATKNVTTGDGGMVITRDRRLAARMKTLSLHGMTADAWSRFKGRPGHYRVEDAGFKYNMTDIAAAVGLPQLAEVETRWQRRRAIWDIYMERLGGLPLMLPPPPEPGTRHAYHLFTPLLRLDELGGRRDDVIAAMRAENVLTGVHYVPVHQQPYYRRRFGYAAGDFPGAAFVGRRTLSLPIAADLTDPDVADVCRALDRVLAHVAKRRRARPARRSVRPPLLASWEAEKVTDVGQGERARRSSGAGARALARLPLVPLLVTAVLWSACTSPRASSDAIRLQLPVAQSALRFKKEYVLTAGDQLDVLVWRVPEASRSVVVRSDGYISLPLLQDVPAAGLTPRELADKVTRLLSARLVSPEVTVIPTQVRQPMVYIVGDVNSVVGVPLRDAPTAAQAIAMAGGLKRSSAPEDVSIIRLTPDGYVRAIPVVPDVGGQPGPMMALRSAVLQPDDIVFVPENGTSQVGRFLDDFVTKPFTALNSVLWTAVNFRYLQIWPPPR